MSLLDLPHQPSPATDLPPEQLRRLFRRHAAGVAVITASHAGRPVGLLVSSLASVSSTPPILSFNVARTASAWPALAASEHLAVHVLDGAQQDVATLFATSGADRFEAPTRWSEGPHGVPVIDGVAAWALVTVERRIAVADHVLVLARVQQTETRDDAVPLVHHDGTFHLPVPTTPTNAATTTDRSQA